MRRSLSSARPLVVSLALLGGGCCYFPAPTPGSSGAAAPGQSAGSPPPIPAIAPVAPALPAGSPRVRRVVVSLPTSKEDGRGWDAGGGAPDPYVIIRQAGAALATTERVQDSLSGAWAMDVAVSATEPFYVEVVDRDLSTDDPVASIEIDPDVVIDEGPLTYWGGTYRLEMAP